MKEKDKIGIEVKPQEFYTFLNTYLSDRIDPGTTVIGEPTILYPQNSIFGRKNITMKAIDNNPNFYPKLEWKIYYYHRGIKTILKKDEMDNAVRAYCHTLGHKMDYYQILGGVRLKSNNPEYKEDMPVVQGIWICFNGLIDDLEQTEISEETAETTNHRR